MDRIGLAATVSALVVSALGVGFVTLLTVGEGHLEKPQQSTASTVAADYLRDVRPILERRCIVCHGCYDAPCQLKLTSAEGISRGGSKDPVYNSQRLSVMEPTRLYIDAKSDKGWRRKGFFSVSAGEKGTDSTLQRMLDLGRAHPVATGKRLPKTVELDINRPLACPANASEFSEYARENPKGGMPYATAELTAREYSVLSSWAGKGAPADDPAPELSPALIAAISNWEAMLNGTSDKSRLSARYLYEHLFLAHLYFSDSDSKQFFRLVRSSTASGEPVNELDTRHANDDPGPDPFFYRLRPITATIVSKTHIVYPLSAVKLLRVREMLFGGEWQISRLPGYIDETAGNPFAVFAEIPARSRYQFLLDNIRFIIMTFIRGPVCRGQVALNVIDDHFFVVFLDPDYDLSVADPGYLEQAKALIKVPELSASPLTLPQRWNKYYRSHRSYLAFREKSYFEDDPKGKKVTMDAFWPGNAINPTGHLTIFRHFDSASVVKGFVGKTPKKLWVLDYPILERIYYNLVANYDVFGNVTHQLLTRLSMDYMRMEAEDLALTFMPKDRRQTVRDSWYAGTEGQLALYLAHALPERQRRSAIRYVSGDAPRELMERLRKSSNQPAGQLDNTVPLARLSRSKGGFAKWMPDLTLLKVEGAEKAEVYTLIRNKAHTNVSFMFGEDLRRLPDQDTMTVVEGFIGNYPNFFFRVSAGDLTRFVGDLEAVADQSGFGRVVEIYGVRRSSSEFWGLSDWFNDRLAATNPIEAGVLDLSRYGNY